MSRTETLDVVTASILGAKLGAVVHDMGTTLATVARSTQLSTSRAFGCAILDERGEVVAVDDPLHLPSLQQTAEICLEYYRFDLAADDVIMTNDPYGGGSSLHYFTLVAPLGYEDDTVAYLAVRAHMPDIGGVVMGNYHPTAWELWQEGARFTPLKLVVEGKRRRNAIDTLLLNGRDPEGFRGDLEASLATVNVGRERLLSLIQEHGLETIKAGMAESVDYSERVFRTAISRIPDGTYAGEALLDHDGQGREDLAVRVTLERRGERVVLDFTGTDAQSAGFVNSPPANTLAFALLPLLGFVDESVPRNAGLLRAVEVRLPEGTLVNPTYPAPTGWCQDHVGFEIAAAVGGALSDALPGEAGIGHASRPLAYSVEKRELVGGVEEQLGRTDFVQLAQPGANASSHGDGWGPPGAAARALLPSVEEFEGTTGVTITRLEYRADSGGAGRFRGAPATETAIRFPRGGYERLYACTAGRGHPPDGQLGGLSASPGLMRLSIAGETSELDAVVVDRSLSQGAELTILAAGGGGWGDPRERDPDAVSADVLDGYVTAEAAQAVYGAPVDGSALHAQGAAPVAAEATTEGGA
jgi:N-methylhydantoinase B